MNTFDWFEKRSLILESLEYPKVVYSFSSKSLRDITNNLEQYMPFLKSNSVLLSAYDIIHTYDEKMLSKLLEDFSGELFIDSGQFESENVYDLNEIHFYEYKPESWDVDLYIECLNNLKALEKKFYVVNYDDRSKINHQIQQSLSTFEQYNFPGKRILLVHPEGDYWDESSIETLIENLTSKVTKFNILGITEKELGSNLGNRIKNLHHLRNKINSITDQYLPIHIFGCGDPKNITLLFFAGGDIFDGLSWLRFYFKENSSIYTNEFYFDNYNEKTLNNDLYLHNIQYLANLEYDLNYAIGTNDIQDFSEEIEFVNNNIGE